MLPIKSAFNSNKAVSSMTLTTAVSVTGTMLGSFLLSVFSSIKIFIFALVNSGFFKFWKYSTPNTLHAAVSLLMADSIPGFPLIPSTEQKLKIRDAYNLVLFAAISKSTSLTW